MKTIAIKSFGKTPFGAAFYELNPFPMGNDEQALAYKNLGHTIVTVDDEIGEFLLTNARNSARLQEHLGALVTNADQINPDSRAVLEIVKVEPEPVVEEEPVPTPEPVSFAGIAEPAEEVPEEKILPHDDSEGDLP